MHSFNLKLPVNRNFNIECQSPSDISPIVSPYFENESNKNENKSSENEVKLENKNELPKGPIIKQKTDIIAFFKERLAGHSFRK